MEKIKGTIKKYISGKRRTKKLKPINYKKFSPKRFFTKKRKSLGHLLNE